MLDATAIVTTTGTRPQHLARAVDSVLRQKVLASETVVVVDGDAERERAVREMVGDRARIIGNGACFGVSAARNAGVRQANGVHVCFLDDDDCWKPDYLERVFSDGPEFDLALTAFEKHLASGRVVPEKVPPLTLARRAFAARNGGLRGSNLIVRRAVLDQVGGFDEALPALVDMDIAVRLAEVDGVRYRRVTDPLVEYHSHAGPRLTSRNSAVIPEAIHRYLVKHGSRFDCLEDATFRERARRFWGRDPWAPPNLAKRRRTVGRQGLVEHFGGLLHGTESRLLEEAWETGSCSTGAIEELCAEYEEHPDRPPVPKLRLALTTTDNPGALTRLVGSLRNELDRTGWGRHQLGRTTVISLLVVENDSDHAVREENRRFLDELDDARLRVVHRRRPEPHRPWPIGAARAFLLEEARRLGWIPSSRAPLWLVDEDLHWETLLPSQETTWTVRPFGSLLHRVEVLARDTSADVLFGGTTGSPPVPALSTVTLQIRDLLARSGTVPYALAREHPDYYYDLTRWPGADERVGVPCAWWRGGGAADPAEWLARLLGGVPVTRPAVHAPHAPTGSAWLANRNGTVVGGNLLLLSDKALRPDGFAQVRADGLVSRRADTCWLIRATSEGARVSHYAFPLHHARTSNPSPDPYALASELLSDALGVGLYRSLENGTHTKDVLGRASLLARRRRDEILANLDTLCGLLRDGSDLWQRQLRDVVGQVRQSVASSHLQTVLSPESS